VFETAPRGRLHGVFGAIYLVVGLIIALLAQKGVFDALIQEDITRTAAALSGVAVFTAVYAFWFATWAFLARS